ncbi:hypothetical protein ACL58G_29240 [Massilia sp. GER05]|uniref:hypothetical protein n=1 Tax=Massilia sp. GER05 TaxID=3394605 RepID=UPI003F830133
MSKIEDKVKVKQWLPHGEQLRVLLGSDHISPGEVASTLRSKGVFNVITEKSATIPILAASILLPNEFVKLLETSVSRESKLKEQPQDIQLSSADAAWQKCFKSLSGELVTLVGLDDLHGVSFSRAPQVKFDGHSKAYIEYEINRRDFSQDLLGRDLNFIGRIGVEQKNGALRLDFLSQHSSKETQRINERVLKVLSTALKTAGLTKTDEPRKIVFGAFENKNRILFMLHVASRFEGSKGNGTIVDVTIRKNEAHVELPNDPGIKWMEGSVRNLKVDGDKLNNFALLANSAYHDYFFLTRVLVEYEFAFGNFEGSCNVVYAFDKIRSIEKIAATPFHYSIDRIAMSSSLSGKALADVRSQIGSRIRRAVELEFEKFKT